jgi:hypothetical protein
VRNPERSAGQGTHHLPIVVNQVSECPGSTVIKEISIPISRYIPRVDVLDRLIPPVLPNEHGIFRLHHFTFATFY